MTTHGVATILGYTFLAVAALCTLLYLPISFTIRPLAGPDAMEFAGLVFLTIGRWIALATALAIAVARRGFSWVHADRGPQAIALLLLLVASGGMELWSLIAATSGWYGRAARPWVFAFAFAVPLMLVLLTAAAMHPGHGRLLRAASPRMITGGMLLLIVAGALVLGVKDGAAAKERRAHAAEMEREREQFHNEKLDAFRALGPASPLRAWLPWTNESEDEIREAAVESIRARPRLLEELTEILQSDDPLPALRWLWLWSPHPDPAYAQPVLGTLRALPEWARRRLDDDDPTNDPEISTACEALVVIADEFPEMYEAFRPSFEELRAFLQSRALPEERMSYDRTYQARAMLQYWFDRHP